MDEILLVDDDHFFRQVYSELLRSEGYLVDTAGSGHEAMQMLKPGHGLVIADLVMPDMSGLDLLARVRRHQPSTDLIIVTGHADVETAISALKNGARDYLIKPVNHDEFKHAVAVCLEQRKLFSENKELKGLVHLLQAGQAIATCFDPDRLRSLVVDLLAKEVGVKRAVGLFADDAGRLTINEINGFNNSDGIKLIEALTPSLLEGQAVVSLEQLQDFLPPDFAFAKVGAEPVEAMALYIRGKKSLQGAVVLFNDIGKPLPKDVSRRNITFILEQASSALESARRFSSVKNLLYLDDLTELFNHRYLDISLDRELKRAERYGSGIALIFLDIDTFKGVNDCYGHLVGSAILKELGQVLKMAVREIDTVIRYGGDEFIIILVETHAAEASVVAERIRNSIENRSFMKKEGYEIRLTATLGYACYPDDAASRQELIDCADQAMYRGKNAGRNRVISAREIG